MVDAALILKARDCLVAADSLLSFIGHRYGHAVAENIRRDALAVSADCRRTADEIGKSA
jgi:hypothetical protein